MTSRGIQPTSTTIDKDELARIRSGAEGIINWPLIRRLLDEIERLRAEVDGLRADADYVLVDVTADPFVKEE